MCHGWVLSLLLQDTTRTYGEVIEENVESSRENASQAEWEALQDMRQKQLKEWDAKMEQRQKDAEES